MDSYPTLGPPSAAQVLQLDNYNNDEGYDMKDEFQGRENVLDELADEQNTAAVETKNVVAVVGRNSVASRLVAALAALAGSEAPGMWIVNPIADALKATAADLAVLIGEPKALLEAAKVRGLVVDLPVPGALVILQMYPSDVYWLAVVESVHDGSITVYTTQSFRRDAETELRLVNLPVPNHDGIWKTIAYINFDKE